MLSAVVERIRITHPAMDMVALIDPENARSIRLFQHLSFVQECYAESIHSLVYCIYGE